MDKDHAMLLCLWAVYGILHSVFATLRVKNLAYGINISEAAYRMYYNVFAFLSLLPLIYLQFQTQSKPIFTSNAWTYIIGFIVGIAGVAIMAVCIAKYFRQMTGVHPESKKQVLHVTGLHSYVRHPLYLGTFLFLLGLACLFPLLKNILAVMIIITYTTIAVRFEERKLVRQFGEAYKRYQQEVPMLIPFT